MEGIAQTGEVGALTHRAHAWVAQIGRQTALLDKPLDIAAEYKVATGETSLPEMKRAVFAGPVSAAHDKFGHADWLGWRNIRNVKAFAVWSATKSLTVLAMYNNSWLYDRHDAVSNSQGRAVARSPLGTAGSHIGQEADIYFTYKKGGWTTGAGYGHLFPGEFLKKTTPGISSPHTYSKAIVTIDAKWESTKPACRQTHRSETRYSYSGRDFTFSAPMGGWTDRSPYG